MFEVYKSVIQFPEPPLNCGKFKYVVADIVFAVNPFVKFVDPLTVPPVKTNGGKF